jgi:hypothetical protein
MATDPGEVLMIENEAFPVVFFMLSFFVFSIMLLYALARAWQKALSTRPSGECASEAPSTGPNCAGREVQQASSISRC